MFASFSDSMFEIATGRGGGGVSCKLRAAMHNLIVHIPVWSSAAVPPPERRGGCFLQTQMRTVIKNELHIYFLFPHLNYLCNLL